jgi:hypothetical protein
LQAEIVRDRKFALSEPLQAFEFLFQLFDCKDALPDVLDGFDETQANATKTVSTILRHSYRSISSKSGMDRKLREKTVVAVIS